MENQERTMFFKLMELTEKQVKLLCKKSDLEKTQNELCGTSSSRKTKKTLCIVIGAILVISGIGVLASSFLGNYFNIYSCITSLVLIIAPFVFTPFILFKNNRKIKTINEGINKLNMEIKTNDKEENKLYKMLGISLSDFANFSDDAKNLLLNDASLSPKQAIIKCKNKYNYDMKMNNKRIIEENKREKAFIESLCFQCRCCRLLNSCEYKIKNEDNCSAFAPEK